MSAKRYLDEFKIEAVKQDTNRGHSMADVAKQLDITPHSLYTLLKKFDSDSHEHAELSEAQAKMLQVILDDEACQGAASEHKFNRRSCMSIFEW